MDFRGDADNGITSFLLPARWVISQGKEAYRGSNKCARKHWKTDIGKPAYKAGAPADN
jgi:hypothetical protein